MIKSISRILMGITLLLSAMHSFAQVKHATTTTIKISGNCGMCKATIEKAGNAKKAAQVDWNQASKVATITYDSSQTNINEILKRIALAGYDNDAFLAPDDTYAQLPECCQYDRTLKPKSKTKAAKPDQEHSQSDHELIAYPPANAAPLHAVFDGYFSLKEALVKTDAGAASAEAGSLVTLIKSVDMARLTAEEHTVWMKVMRDLAENAEKISRSRDISKQRESFALLSRDIYGLAKVSDLKDPVYYQHCPMYNNGANWLSKESAISNPYYGSKMMTCGSTVETLD